MLKKSPHLEPALGQVLAKALGRWRVTQTTQSSVKEEVAGSGSDRLGFPATPTNAELTLFGVWYGGIETCFFPANHLTSLTFTFLIPHRAFSEQQIDVSLLNIYTKPLSRLLAQKGLYLLLS